AVVSETVGAENSGFGWRSAGVERFSAAGRDASSATALAAEGRIANHGYCRFQFPHRRGRNHHHAHQHKQRSQQSSRANALSAQKMSKGNGHHRIDIGVSPNFGWRLMVKQPNIGRVSDD